MATSKRGAQSKSGTSKSQTKSRKATTGKKKSTSRTRPAARGDKSVEAFRDALERSVTLSRDRLQEVVDDAVKRGRMTRSDANELVNKILTRGRQQTDDLIKEMERLLDQTRRQVETHVTDVESRVRAAAEPALAEADKLRRRAGVGSTAPITGYDDLNVSQVRSRLKDLNAAELRKVRTQEKRGKARKSVLDDIEQRLGQK